MGVRGLSTWLHEYGTHAANLTQLDGAILLVDGNGLAFALLDAPEHAMRARACDYGALDRAARAVLTNLQRANAVVELYFDGTASHHKAAQLAHRSRQRAARAESLRADCLDRVTVHVDKLPEPDMLVLQVIATAESLGIPTHRCAGEADIDLARACAAGTAAGAECWVVGEDTDFLFYRGIRYLRLSELQLRSGGKTCSIYSASVPGAGRLELIGRGWSRSLLSELSELPEALLPDWAAIAGNDFTHSYPLASYGQSTVDAFDSGDGVATRRPTAEEARLWLQEKAGSSTDLPRDWLAAEAEPSLQTALCYSRATYDLSDSGSLDDAAAATNSDHAEVEVLLGCTTGAAADIDVTTVGGAALAELMDGLQGRVIARIDGKEHQRCESSARPHQLEALRRISRNERVQLDADSGSTSALHGLAWEDVAVASCYQRLCSLLLRSNALEPVAPSSLFDGPSFYTFCSEARQIELSHVPPTPSRQPIVPVPAAVTVSVDMAAYGAGTHLAGLCLRCGAAGAVALADDGNSYCLQCHACRAAGVVDGSDEGEPIQRQPSEEAAVQRGQLPVDGYADTILKSIRDHRVSIIAGETGCGKSSRIPELLLEDSPNARIMVAQPRRIAAHSLFTRARTVGSFPDEVGLRMGHGVRDEGPRTRLWYVTTGYLVRYVSTGIRRGNLNGLTHLVVDECHERSTETELLCLLARRLLARLPHLRVVLMSATLDEALFMPYFRSAVGPTGVAPSLFVGARRFPVTEYCLEDLFSLDALPNSIVKAAGRLQQACDKLCAVDYDSDDSGSTEEEDADPLPLPSALVTVQLELALWITRLAPQRRDGNGGVAVLIFVAGMAEIEHLAEALADKESYIFCPIHSELPFDETLEAFEPAPTGKTKVVVATNAAESSVTIPDVDLVIDLGAIKRLQYDSARQSACLCREWTSRAAAQQRAGRTGRVRPGEVWRLYPRAFIDRHLRPQEPSQIKRQPLENTILAIRAAVDQEQSIMSLMGELLEPPSEVNVYAALERLATMGMLQDNRGEGGGDHADGIHPDGLHTLDSAPLSALGRLASALPLDARLSRMVGLGVQLGCTAEAIVLAVACGLPRSPFRIISPLIHKDADSYNALVREGFLGRLHFDRGMYSEPLSILSLLGELSGLDAAEPSDATPDAKEERRASRLNSARGVRWCQQHGLAAKEVRNLLSTLRSIRESIAPILGVPASSLVPPPGPFPSPGIEGGYKLSLLRALLVWCSHDSLISSAPLARSGPRADSQVRAIQLPVSVSDESLRRLLPPPLTWICNSRGFDVVQVTRTRKGDDVACRLREAITQRLLDALEPDLVFAFAPNGLCMWKREASVSKYAEAMIRNCLGDQFPAAGWGGLDDEGAPGWALIEVSEVSKPQRAALRHLSSRRGLAHDYSVATLHLIESGGASLTSTGCTSLTEGSAELLPWAQKLIHELFGEEAVARALPGHSVPTKQLQFEGDERVVVAEGCPPPLVDDRHAGVRLLASMAAGYRDRRLYLGTGLATETAAEEEDSARIGVKLDVPEGLEWFMVGSPEVAGARVLLGRHSLLKVALPSSRAIMYAVGAAPLFLGAGGTLASMDMVTFLPPGDEWTELVLRCMGRSLPGGRNSHALAAQRNLADAIHSELRGADVEHLPATSAKLRHLLEPWITHAALPSRPDADSLAVEAVANERARECSICFEELHENGQLPSIPCPTCSNRFHPTCLFTWFGSHDGGGRNRCPLCKSEMT